MELFAIEQKKLEKDGPKYMDCRFVLGSVAIVERLWSLAKALLPHYRKNCSPMLTEAFLFLKVNRAYWDIGLVCDAMAKTRSDKVLARMEEERRILELLGLADEAIY